MNDNVRIVDINKKEILVVPMITGACINCQKSGCAKQGKPFPISNPQGFPISIGSIVKIRSNKISQILQGIFALVLPLVGAVAGYFLGGLISANCELKNTEIAQACGVLIGLVVFSAVIFTINAKSRKLKKSEICEVVQ